MIIPLYEDRVQLKTKIISFCREKDLYGRLFRPVRNLVQLKTNNHMKLVQSYSSFVSPSSFGLSFTNRMLPEASNLDRRIEGVFLIKR
jgi:hypothetical protein